MVLWEGVMSRLQDQIFTEPGVTMCNQHSILSRLCPLRAVAIGIPASADVINGPLDHLSPLGRWGERREGSHNERSQVS